MISAFGVDHGDYIPFEKRISVRQFARNPMAATSAAASTQGTRAARSKFANKLGSRGKGRIHRAYERIKEAAAEGGPEHILHRAQEVQHLAGAMVH